MLFDCEKLFAKAIKCCKKRIYSFIHPGQLCLSVHVVNVGYCLFLTYWTGVREWDRTTTGEYCYAFSEFE